MPRVGAHTEEIFISLLSWARYSATVGPLVSLTLWERLANDEGMECTYIDYCENASCRESLGSCHADAVEKSNL